MIAEIIREAKEKSAGCLLASNSQLGFYLPRSWGRGTALLNDSISKEPLSDLQNSSPKLLETCVLKGPSTESRGYIIFNEWAVKRGEVPVTR